MNIRKTLRASGLIAVLFVLFGLLADSNVRAQSCTKEGKAEAKVLIKQGTQYLRELKARLAVAAFKQAYGHCKARVIQFNLALAYLVLGERVTAATHLRRYLNGATAAERRALPPPLKLLLTEVGVLRVQVRIATATIWVDGQLRGSGRVEIVVLPGLKVVEIRFGDRVLKHTKLEVAAGQTAVWNPHIDAKPRRTGLPRRAIPTHLARGTSTSSASSASSASSSSRRLHWAYFASVAVVAAVGGVALTYTGVRTFQLREDWRASPSDAIEKDFDRYKLISNVLVGVAATAGIAAAIIAVFTRWRRNKPEKPRVSVSFAFIPGGGGLTVCGRY